MTIFEYFINEEKVLSLRHETHFPFTGDPSLTTPCPLFHQISTFSKITTNKDGKKMITIITRPAGKVPESEKIIVKMSPLVVIGHFQTEKAISTDDESLTVVKEA